MKPLHRLAVPGFMLILGVLTGTGAMAKECLDCHADVLKQLKGNSHHIQGTEVTSRHCYACHWEATAGGRINVCYHAASKNTSKVKKGQVDLVLWQEGGRPTAYRSGKTAVTYVASAIGTPAEREEVQKISFHCLGCHSDSGNSVRPFAGDVNLPQIYAWDGQSIASRYSNKAVTAWGKYSTATTNRKQQITKAFSAHGNAVANSGGWSLANGYDEAVPLTRNGSRNVECFDCHNSHGSTVSGVTSSYLTSDGSFNGGILKETFAGKGGYHKSYMPSVNSYANSKNPFNAGAGLCFDCHETAQAGNTPWGYNSTFGAAQPIMGYKDTYGFGPGRKGSTERFANRHSREDIASSHLKAVKPLDHMAQGQINGLCTPCHDPHGVSVTLGKKMPYAVPLLKDTWLTSPYREDGPPSGLPAKGDSVQRDANADKVTKRPNDNYNLINREANANFGKGASGAAREADYNRVNREANANFGKGDSTAPRLADYNVVNREANANFGKGTSGAAREADYNRVNREANANFGKGDSTAPRQADYNVVNREANANFGKGTSGAAREADYNRVNREANANFGKGDSTAPRQADYNVVNREANANFGKGTSGAARGADFNMVNREANANFGKVDSTAPRPADYNVVNREANANFGKGVSDSPREKDSNTTNRDANSNFAKSASGAPREPMKGMKYHVDQNTFGKDERIIENEDIFGGLCLKCHSKENLTGDSKSGPIHRSVKGWGNNKEHSFPCSKCHQSHSSGLPRLMQTNCFEQGPSGLRENSGVPWLPYKQDNKLQNQANQTTVQNSETSKTKVVGCHVKQFGKAMASSPKEHQGDQWKDVTPW